MFCRKAEGRRKAKRKKETKERNKKIKTRERKKRKEIARIRRMAYNKSTTGKDAKGEK